MDFERQTIDGYDLRLARVHNGGRPTVVMTNAFPQSIRCWESLWERLAENFDLLAVDLPGFGRSTGSGAVMRPSAQADVLARLMDANGIDEASARTPWSCRCSKSAYLTVFDDAGHFSHEDADNEWLQRFLTFAKDNRGRSNGSALCRESS